MRGKEGVRSSPC